MKNDSLSILKTFTRKLANSRYRVSTKTLIDELKNGEFGYTIEEGIEEVVNNDYVLADDFATLIDHIRPIFKEPRIFLKRENIVQHVENASKFDNSTLKSTYKDEKLWRFKNGQPAPEFVHSYVYEDDLAIYENKFVCYVVDQVYEAITKKINELALSVETVNRKMGGETDNLFTTAEYVDFMGKELPVLITNDDATVGVIRSLIKTKKLLISFKNKPLYQACKKEGSFNPLGLKPTNILLKDPNYHYCYNFYLNYLNKDPNFQSEDKMYLGYVTVNLLGALSSLGFELSQDNENIGVNHSAVLKFNQIVFNKQPFRTSVSQYGEDGLLLTVEETVDGNEGKYLFRAINSTASKNIEGFTNLSEYVANLSQKDESFIKTFIVNDIEEISDFNAVHVVPSQANSVEIFAKAVKSCFLLALGSSFMHTRYCPVCGSKLVSAQQGDIECSDCGTLYHVFNYQDNDMVWFKDLPKSCQYASENETKPAAEELALTEFEFGQLSVNRKSFMEKLADSDSYTQNYYNQLKHTLKSYKKVNSRVSRSYDRFNLGRKTVAKIGLRGKTLVLYLALNPEDYQNTKYYPRDVSDTKKYADTPMMVKVKSDRGLKFALELIDVLLDGVPKNPPTELIDYVQPEIPAEMLKGSYVKKSFVGKLCQTEGDEQEYYSRIKTALLSYKKVNSRVSFSYDSFNLGRKALAKVGVRGKTLVLYLALNPENYQNTKYYPRDVSDIKKYADTPMMIKVKSGRGIKYALELIGIMLEGTKKKAVTEEYKFFEPYKTDAQLVKKGLAKIVKGNSKFS